VNRPAPVAVALDAPDLDTAARWAALVTPHVSTVKIGLELYLRYGPDIVATVRGASGVEVFLDLKLHDIPATVAGATRAVSRLRPEILTVHASAGADVIRAAVEAAPGTCVAAVTVLTSLSGGDLVQMGIPGPVDDVVRRLAVLAVSAGARGLVCSPHEVSAVRAEVGPDVKLITPGVRPDGSDSHDQARVATPEDAVRAGADLLVIGRPITRAPDPGAAAAAVAASLRRAAPGTTASGTTGAAGSLGGPAQGRVQARGGPLGGVLAGGVRLGRVQAGGVVRQGVPACPVARARDKGCPHCDGHTAMCKMSDRSKASGDCP
jgi:orotidine-5'-phosphate decarboxylase